MTRTQLYILVCTLHAYAATPPVYATPSQPAPTIAHVVREVDPRIWCIHQAANGDLWFGSNGAGAYRYDGQTLTHYDLDDGLAGLQVRDIEDDNQGGVLISTNTAVSRFDGETFSTLEVVEAATEAYGWTLDPNDVWIVHEPGEQGPARYDGRRLHVLKLPKSPAEDEFLARNPGYPQDRFPASGVYSISRDRRGHVWIGTANVGLCRFDGDTISWMYEQRLTTTPSGGAFGIRSIFEDSTGRFWICNTRSRFAIAPHPKQSAGYSLLQYAQGQGLPEAGRDDSPNFTYSPSIAEDSDGALWFACGSDGVWWYDGDQVTKHALSHGAYAITLCIDDAGTLWVGTLEHGVFVFNETGFVPAFNSEPAAD